MFPLVLLSLLSLVLADVIPLSVPSSPSSGYVVHQNFLGISFELSFLDAYFGTGPSSIPNPIVNYLTQIRSRTGSTPVRIRVGGNSLDTSTYVPTQITNIIQRDPPINSDNQPAHYGPVVWDVLSKVALTIKGATYTIGLSLINATNPLVPIAAADAYTRIGGSLDAFILGNEPDEYSSHGFRPTNWTEASYIKDFKTSSSQLRNTTAGNILSQDILAGPSMCCGWSLDTLIKDGFISSFGSYLKYITLQHYANSNCFGFNSTASYFTQHSNVIQLGTWQMAGIISSLSKNETVIMSEFNSISCGGVPGISNTFAVGSLWTVDYALQLASVGYTAAHLHTREPGVSYNIFTASDLPATSSSRWTTNPSFYGLLVTAEALRSKNGSIVVDLKLGGASPTTPYAGYAVFDADDKTVQQLILFNYANVSISEKQKTTFSVPQPMFSSDTRQNLAVKYLVGQSMSETTNIGWGGTTFAGVADGVPVNTTAHWAPATVHVDCSKGCNIDVPAPGLAVVFAGGLPNSFANPPNSTTSASPRSCNTNSIIFTIVAIWVYLML